MGKREDSMEDFAPDLAEVTPDIRVGFTPKREVFEALTRLNGWKRSICNNYYSDAVQWLADRGLYITMKTGRNGGIAKSRNAEHGRDRWQHSRKVMLAQRRRANEYGSCLADDGVDGIVAIDFVEQPLLPAPQTQAKT